MSKTRSAFSTLSLASAVALAVSPALTTTASAAPTKPAKTAATSATKTPTLPGGYKNLVVIYEENHSFDNLWGSWGKVGKDTVDGTKDIPQITQDGKLYNCLPQNDVNLTTPPLPSLCQDPANGVKDSAFANKTYKIDDYIKPTDTTCSPEDQYAPNGVKKGEGLPGGCTEDQVHRFYQEQYQINGGKQNRYVTGSDALGLTMGQYDTKALPLYKYLHSTGAPNYVIADRFFQAAFGGSFLNHQFLISAQAPLDTSAGAKGAKNSILDDNGMPKGYQQYKPTKDNVVDGQLTQKCADGSQNYAKACGDWAVNTVQPDTAPAAAHGAKIPLIDDAKYPNIGDRMNAAGISWNWYSGGWDAAAAGNPGPLFQYHHQPFNYFKDYAVGGPQRHHLQDETKFFEAAKNGTLPTVSFVKPYGAENEHPGYASEHTGSDHLVNLIKTIMDSPQGDDTLIVVTYDEFGGSADHVAVPKVDAWGPGTRIPAMLLSKRMTKSGVVHEQYDTTSILATIERSFGLNPMSSRDASVNDLTKAIKAGGGKDHEDKPGHDKGDHKPGHDKGDVTVPPAPGASDKPSTEPSAPADKPTKPADQPSAPADKPASTPAPADKPGKGPRVETDLVTSNPAVPVAGGLGLIAAAGLLGRRVLRRR